MLRTCGARRNGNGAFFAQHRSSMVRRRSGDGESGGELWRSAPPVAVFPLSPKRAMAREWDVSYNHNMKNISTIVALFGAAAHLFSLALCADESPTVRAMG